MLESDRNYLSVPKAAKLAGLTNQAIYDLIRKKKVPFQQESVDGQRRYKIPASVFLVWLERDIVRHEQKMNFLKKSHRELKEYLHHG